MDFGAIPPGVDPCEQIKQTIERKVSHCSYRALLQDSPTARRAQSSCGIKIGLYLFFLATVRLLRFCRDSLKRVTVSGNSEWRVTK
jgi:hypothetical protein